MLLKYLQLGIDDKKAACPALKAFYYEITKMAKEDNGEESKKIVWVSESSKPKCLLDKKKFMFFWKLNNL